MWKWTDPNNIKAIILDVDSLGGEDYLNFPYNQVLPNVQLFFVQHRDTLSSFEN